MGVMIQSSGVNLSQIDRLTSITTTAGKTLIFTSDGTDSTLTWSDTGRLIFKGPNSTPVGYFYDNNATFGSGLSVRGGLAIGLGTSLSGAPIVPNSNNSILRISEDSSDRGTSSTAGWLTALYLDPYQNSNCFGGNIIIGQYATLFNDGFDCHDGDNTAAREHWDEDNDAATYDANYPVVSGVNQISQTFTTTIGSAYFAFFYGASFKAYRTGNPGTATLTLKAVDGSFKPTGSALATINLDVSAITTNPTGEWISFAQTFSYVGNNSRLSPSTMYALVLTVNGAGTLSILADDSSNGFPGGVGTGQPGYGWTSADNGSTWVDTTGGVRAFAFATYESFGLDFTLTGHQVQLAGSFSGGKLLGRASRFSQFYANTNLSLPASSPAWTYIAGIDINQLSVAGGTAPTRSYGVRIATAGNGTTSWGMNTSGRIQFNTITQIILGGTATTVGVNYISRGGTNEIQMGLAALTNVHYLWTTTAFSPQSTIRTQDLGVATTKGWNSLYLQDSAASFTLQLLTTNTSISANRTLTLNAGNSNRTITLSGNPTLADWFDQSVKIAATPTFAGAKIGVSGLDIGTGTLPTTTWLLIAAGASGFSQIQLTSSTAPSSPVAGDIWYDGTYTNFWAGIGIKDSAANFLLQLKATGTSVSANRVLTFDTNNANRSIVLKGDVNTGTYTPTLTNVANLAASTAYQCQWLRVGDMVTVSGKVDVDPTLTATTTQLGISLPVASNLGAEEDCAGTAFASGIAGQGAAIRGDATNDRAEMVWISGDITNQSMFFIFTYQII